MGPFLATMGNKRCGDLFRGKDVKTEGEIKEGKSPNEGKKCMFRCCIFCLYIGAYMYEVVKHVYILAILIGFLL